MNEIIKLLEELKDWKVFFRPIANKNNYIDLIDKIIKIIKEGLVEGK